MADQITGLLSPLLASIRLKTISKEIKGGNILDFGCGRGDLLKFLSCFDFYIGVDIDIFTIKKCRERIRKQNVFFQTLSEFIEKPQLRNFDYIVLAAVLEHLDNPKNTISWLKEFLNENGKIIITTPTRIADIFLSFGSKIGIFSREAYKEHKIYFNKKSFQILAEELGFKIKKYKKFELGLNQLLILEKLEKRY